MPIPIWMPNITDVANYVTSRTVDTVTPGSDTPTGTFSANTYPTDAQVDSLIQDACGWVLAVTGTITTDLEDTAKAVAAMRAAGMVELTYPIRNNEIDQVATILLAEAQTGRDELVAANRTSGGSPVSSVPSPRGSFPDAPCRMLDGPAWGFER